MVAETLENIQKQWRCFSASVIGSGHISNGTPCQDAHCVSITDLKFVCAISDGAGSAKFSQIGSKTAVNAAIVELTELTAEPDRQEILQVVNATKAAVEYAANQHEVSPSELACTLILIWATANCIVVGQIGDGAVVASIDGKIEAVSRPQNGEYLNQTTFLTSDNYDSNLVVTSRYGTIQSVAGFTDGIELVALKLPEAEPFEPFFQSLFDFVQVESNEIVGTKRLEDFLLSDRLRERTDDDLTLTLACLVPSGGKE